MHDMPPSVVPWYRDWLREYPESFHPYDKGRFYAFVHMLLKSAKKPHSRGWLEANLREDCPRCDGRVVEHYGQLFEIITEFATFWHTHQGQSLIPVIHARRLEAIKRRMGEVDT
jgi:hypothetical protein